MSDDPDRAIASLAARQHGNITRAQLYDLGLANHAIAYRIEVGRLQRVFTGVYAVGKPARTPLERAAAAVLACGPGAALSHVSAMALWGFAKHWPAKFDVTVASDRRPTGIIVHRCITLTRRDVTTQLGIRVTSPARTLLDCAPRLKDKALTRAVNGALLSNYLKRSQLAELLERSKPGPAVERLIPFVTNQDGPTRSPFEDDLLPFCEQYGLPRPSVNTIVGGNEVDAFFEAEKLIVELDGYETHSSRAAFEGDRNRDADALASGLGTVRITKARMRDEPDQEAARLHAILRVRRAEAA
jgi:predicted transcriptional regulator of viral defense system